jgi:hypothetical protein
MPPKKIAKKAAKKAPKKAAKRDKLEDFLADLDKDDLTKWLLAVAKDSADVKRRLELFAAQHSSPAEAVKSYKALLKTIGKTRNRNPRKRTREIGANFQQLHAALKADFERGKLDVVVEVLPHALCALNEASDYDMSQQYPDLQAKLETLHFEAAAELRPRPAMLAEQLHDAQKVASGLFVDAAYRYRDILGDLGLAAYRELLEPEWQSCLERLKTAPRRTYDRALDLLREQMLSWARAIEPRQESLREQARVLEQLASSVEDYICGADLYLHAGDRQGALHLAEAGFEALLGRKTLPTRFQEVADLLLRLLREAQRPEEVLAVAWRAFQALPNVASFRHLIAAAHPPESAGQWRQKAHAFALARSHDLMLELLLAEERVEEARRLASDRGLSTEGWLYFTKVLGQRAPEEAIPLLVQIASKQAQAMTWGGTDTVMTLLRQARSIALSANLNALFASEIDIFRSKLPPRSMLLRQLNF